MPKNKIKQSNYNKILDAITSSTKSIKKEISVPLMNLQITALLLQSKEISDISQKEEETEYTIGNYLIKRTLGQGTFGKVKLGIYLPNKEKVAVKILEKERIIEKDDEIRVRREFDMLAKFNHPNVILVAEIFESSNSFYSVMEYCEGGELFNYIVKNQRLNEDEAAFFYYQLINGLEYIHSLGIVHRDLKPENLLLTNDHILKIIDFGLSNYFTSDPNQELLITPCGSPCYASPEMVAGKKYNGFKIDIWATGIILYAMLCGYLPFEDKNNDILFKKILECKVKYPKYVGEKAKDLIKKILVKEPDERITISQIKKHTFFIKGKNLFEQEFSLCPNSSSEADLKLSNSNLFTSKIEDKENRDKEKRNENKEIKKEIKNKENINNLNVENENENKKDDIEDNILLTLPQEAIYKPLKTELVDKSCQFYSDLNSEQDLNIAVEENDRNDELNIFEEKVEIKNEEKKNEKMNKTNYNKNKKIINKKDLSAQKTLNRRKSKSKEFIHNKNTIKKNRENAFKKNNYRMFLKNNNNLKVHKTNTHSNLKKKGYSVGLTNIIKKYWNKKTIKKEKPKLNININNINNFINNNNKNFGIQITPSEKKKNKKLNPIDISKNNNGISEEKEKKYLKTDININKEKEKSIKKKYITNNNLLNDIIDEKKTKHIGKKLTNEIGINLNKNEKNKNYENDNYLDNRRMKTETYNQNTEENTKIKRTINSKNNTNATTINNNSHTTNSKNHKDNNNIKKINSNNLNGNPLYNKKKQKNYILQINGHKKRINIIARTKKKSKSIKKSTPSSNNKNLNIINKNAGIGKIKNNIQIKTEINNIPDIIIDKGLKTEIDIQDKDKDKNNKVKNNIKSSTNFNKLENLLENNKYHRALNIPIDNMIGKRNTKKNYSNNVNNSNTANNNKSFNKIQKHKYTSTGLFLKNSNISNFSTTNNAEQKMKVNTNPNITNNKAKISSYNNIPKNKKELVTIRNTVINFNMVNSSLIISSLNKKRHSISNSFHFLNKKINAKKKLNNNNNQNHINRTLNNANITSGGINKNKSNEKLNSIKNYSTNTKKKQNKNKNIINTIPKKDLLNYSENVAKTENNEGPIIKIKNKLEKILLNKLKQNISQDKKHIKYNSVKLDEYNRNNIRKNKIINNKTKNFNKHNSNKCTTNSIFLINKSVSPNNKNIKTISNNDINSNNNIICVQKQNKNTMFCQSENEEKRLNKKWNNI